MRRLSPLLLWLTLVALLAAGSLLVLEGCGIRLFGTTLLNFCPEEEARPAGPPRTSPAA